MGKSIRIVKQILGLGTARLVTASIVCWLATGLAAQNQKQSPQPPAQSKKSANPAGKTGQPKSDSLADIERRIRALEGGFEVVDKAGKPMLRISPGKVAFYNSNGKEVADIWATSEGAEFGANTPDDAWASSFAVTDTGAWTQIYEGDNANIDMGKQEAGNYSLKFVQTSVLRIPKGGEWVEETTEKTLAGIGVSKAGSGALVVGDKNYQKAAMEVFNGSGTFTIFNGTGNGVALLGTSGNGSGVLKLTDAASNVVAEMGTYDNRYGAVMTFPPGFPYVPKSGIPGSYFFGCAGGASCAH